MDRRAIYLFLVVIALLLGYPETALFIAGTYVL